MTLPSSQGHRRPRLGGGGGHLAQADRRALSAACSTPSATWPPSTTPIVIGYLIAATGSFKWALVYVGANALVAVFSYLFIVGRIQRVELRTADGEILGATQPDPARA